MNKVMLSLVLTFAFVVLIVLGVGVFQIISGLLNNDLAVLGVGFCLLYLFVYASLVNTDHSFKQLEVLDEDNEEVV